MTEKRQGRREGEKSHFHFCSEDEETVFLSKLCGGRR